ncbi:hypothetical protein, partial [Lactococcus petauri]|uniref:hypothetical protein n=1 Tax=Lactococcus petauri TaxID=1940789 RepID=UPI0021F14042
FCKRLSVPARKAKPVTISLLLDSTVIARTRIDSPYELIVYFYLNHNGVVSFDKAVIKDALSTQQLSMCPIKIDNLIALSADDFNNFKANES